MDKTRLFDVEEIENALVSTTIDEVADALKEKGYNPIMQIVGYLMSGDTGYITNFNKARDKISSIDRAKILEVLIKEYLNKE